ncbi:MAG TPA: hypothetical protein VJP59_08485 [Gemmatimonadota bacterium]|nr:hypothetical protein [Gemmatimonadota bacterium]
MRFSWLALPILLSTLAGAGGVPVATLEAGEPSAGETATHYAGSAMAVPFVAMPSTAGDAQLTRLGPQRQVRPDHPATIDEAQIPGGPPAREARVRIRSSDRAGFEFLPDLTRAITGSLSSRTTACPPPSSR